jgi:hypothetical protein
MKTPALLAVSTLAAFAVGAGVGFLAHPQSPASTQATSSAGSSDPAARDTLQFPAGGGFSADTPGGGSLPTGGSAMSTAEIEARLDSALKRPNGMSRWRKISALLDDVTAENGHALAELVRNQKTASGREALGLIVGAWAAKDATAAMAYAESIPDNELRKQTILGALGGWAENEPDAALKWARTLPPGELMRNAENIVINKIAETDPERALAMIKSETPGRASQFAFGVFGSWAARDPEQAAAKAAELPPGQLRNSAVQIVAGQWAQQDVSKALEWASQLPQNNAQTQVLSEILRNWAQQDFDASLDWLKKQPGGSRRDRIVQNMSWQQINDNPENALALAELIGSTNEQDGMLRRIAESWGRNDLKSAQEWVAVQTDPAIQKAVWGGLVVGLTQNDPASAATMALSIKDDGTRKEAVSQVASIWANNNPAAAAQWSLQLSDANDRRDALSNVMAVWTNEDTSSALKWFTSVPAGPDRDQAIQRFAGGMLDNDPKTAIEWANSISDQHLREDQVAALSNGWMNTDPDAARQWVNQANISPELRNRILSNPRR